METQLSKSSLFGQQLNALHSDVCSEVERLAKQLSEPLIIEDACDSVMFPGYAFQSVEWIDGGATIFLEDYNCGETTERCPCEMDINDVLYILSELENHFDQ